MRQLLTRVVVHVADSNVIKTTESAVHVHKSRPETSSVNNNAPFQPALTLTLTLAGTSGTFVICSLLVYFTGSFCVKH